MDVSTAVKKDLTISLLILSLIISTCHLSHDIYPSALESETTLFAGGNGTSEDPYQISDVYQLQNMKEDFEAHYILVNDINASETEVWNGGLGFYPIGYASSTGKDNVPFEGTLNGNGFNITGLHINRSESDCNGLFQMTFTGFVVENLSLVNCTIKGDWCTGSLVAANGGRVINCTSTGTVEGRERTGGLIASNNGFIHNCSFTGRVKGSSRSGGLVGMNDGIFTYLDAGEINDCYTYGDFNIDSSNNPLVGDMSGSIENSFYVYERTMRSNDRVYEEHCMFEAQFIKWLNSSRKFLISNFFKYDSENEAYEIHNFDDFKNITHFISEKGSCFIQKGEIILENIPDFKIHSFIGVTYNGNGYSISNLSVENYWDENEVLIDYIDENSTVYDLSLIDVHINSREYVVGGLSGENHGIIRNCTIDGIVKGREPVGGFVGKNFNIIENCKFSGEARAISEGYSYDIIGGIAGENHGSIIGCSVSGIVYGDKDVGGIAGKNEGSILQCNSEVSGHCDYNLGGIAGDNIGEIGNCTATIDFRGEYFVGGIAGRNEGDILDSSSEGEIEGERRLGGISGSNTGNITGCETIIDISTDDDYDSNFIGGLVGENAGSIYSCSVFSGNLSGEDYVGGLVGRNEGNLGDSKFSGYLQGSVYIGGITGESTGVESDCEMRGVMGAYRDTIDEIYSRNSGGIIGFKAGGITSNCKSYCDIYSDVWAGGIASINQGVISDCFYNGSISGDQELAGLIASNSGIINDSHASGIVVGKHHISALFRSNSNRSINCSFKGDIYSTSDYKPYLLGIFGEEEGSNIEKCHFHGQIYLKGMLDHDDDGLTNIEEIENSTDPDDDDSDSDDIPDKWEIDNGLDPNKADDYLDQDEDGLFTTFEYEIGTHPLEWDTDGDGMPDGWEYNNSLNPLYHSSSNDTDGDGMSDLEEYERGKDPNRMDNPVTLFIYQMIPVVIMVLVFSISLLLFLRFHLKNRKKEESEPTGEKDDPEVTLPSSSS
jgi:hypothetical protein